MDNYSKGLSYLGGAITGCAVIAAAAWVTQPTPKVNAATSSAQSEVTLPATASGVQVFVNPETGEFGGPTPAQLENLHKANRALTNRSDEGLVIERQKNGTESVHLGGRFMSVSVATLSDTGVHTTCLAGGSHENHGHTAEEE